MTTNTMGRDEASYHPCTHILIEGLKRLEGGTAVLAEWDRARAQVDAALATQHQEPTPGPWVAWPRPIDQQRECCTDWPEDGK